MRLTQYIKNLLVTLIIFLTVGKRRVSIYSSKNYKSRRLSPPSGLLLIRFHQRTLHVVTLFFCYRTTFCAMTDDAQQIEISQDKVFVRCKDDLAQQHTRKRNRPMRARRPLKHGMWVMADFHNNKRLKDLGRSASKIAMTLSKLFLTY